jgi:hypothetical protein
MGNDRCTRILERLAAGDVVEMMVAVYEIADRLVRDLPDLGNVHGRCLRIRVAHGICGDHACGRHHEHRLRATGSEDVDVVGPVDLPGFEWGRLLGGRRRRGFVGRALRPDGCSEN